MNCPLCPTKLKMGEDRLVKCARFHRFRLVMDDKGCRELVLAVDPKVEGSRVGDRFPGVDNEETFARSRR